MQTIHLNQGYTFVRLADFTGDGKADLLLYNKGNGALSLGVGDGNGGFTFTSSTISPQYDKADIGDFNGDGKMDVFFYNSSNGNSAAGVSGGANGSSFNGFTFTVFAGTISPNFTSVVVADFNGDGKADLALYNANTAIAYLGTGTQSGSGPVTFSFQSLFWSPYYDQVVAEDVNGDGKADVILYNSNGPANAGTEYTGISNGAGGFTYTYNLWGPNYTLARAVPTQATALPSSSAVIPFGSTSPAETLMFTANTGANPPHYFSLIIENAGTYSSTGNVNPAHACYIEYFAPINGNVLTLATDNNPGGGFWVNPGGTPPGTQAQVSNSQCTLDVSRSWVQIVGNQMRLQLAVTFSPSWSGAKEMFADVIDTSGNELHWSNRGSWTVPPYSQVPVTTDHYDVFRTGANVHETTLNTSNAGSLSMKGTLALPGSDTGCIWAQPLYVPQVIINGVKRNILYVATANANVFAYDADNFGAPLWSRALGNNTLGPSLGGAVPPLPTADGYGGDFDLVDCGNAFPGNSGSKSGVVGTPVIDLSTNTLYVVGNLSVNNVPSHYVFGIDISSGFDKLAPSAVASAGGHVSPQFAPAAHLQRGGLLLADYNVLVPYGSYGDHGPYQGWMFSFNRANLGLLDNWNYANTNYGGSEGGTGIWMGGGGAAFDGTSAYFATGNNFPDSTQASLGRSNSLLQVNPFGGLGQPGVGLAQINQFLPPQAGDWVNFDRDLASSRAIVVPGTNSLLVGGKAGNIYVVDRTSVSASGALQSAFNVTGTLGQGFPEISAGLAYWRNSVYVWADGDHLRSFSLTGQPAASGPDTNMAEQGLSLIHISEPTRPY